MAADPEIELQVKPVPTVHNHPEAAGGPSSPEAASRISFHYHGPDNDDGDKYDHRATCHDGPAPYRSRSSRRRSRSRDSTSSARSRLQAASVYGEIQIEYRTLSIQVSEAKAAAEDDDSDSLSKALLSEPNPRLDEYFFHLPYHELRVHQLCSQLAVDQTNGLTEEAAALRLASNGKNTLPRPKTNYTKKILGYVFGGFCSVLWIGSLIFFICWRPLSDPPAPQNLALAILILVVIFLQASFSAFQDWSTERTMNSILDLLPSDTMVTREGQLKIVPSCDLATGDIVHLRIGDKVPADIRILNHSGDVRFDRAVLTGEGEEIEGSIEPTDRNFLETRNIAFMGTVVVNGSCVGMVVLTGDRTVMGRIARSTFSIKQQSTLIQREIWRFVRIIVCLTICLALTILFTWVGWLRVDHPEFLDVPSMLVNVMACIVAFIPEGMPVSVALTVLLIARRMKTTNILPKDLTTVETLGCVNVICSDKTGTLTKGKMSVKSVAFADHEFESTEEFHRVNDEKDGDMAGPTSALHRAALLCNDASFSPTTMHLPITDRRVQGNRTDAAIFQFAAAGTAGDDLKHATTRVLEIPFNSRNKWMLTLFDSPPQPDEDEDGVRSYHAIIKGAPDVLLPACTNYWSAKHNSVRPMDHEARDSIRKLQDTLSKRAERVILICEKTDITTTATPRTNAFSSEIALVALSSLTVVGIVGIIDPPRPGIGHTISECRRAGTRFFMVTGDYALTAAAIAREIGIFSAERELDTINTIKQITAGATHPLIQGAKVTNQTSSLLLDGAHIARLTEDDWNVVCSYEEIVFARTTPEQKLRIVTELRNRHNIVALSGDGVNDAPAMRAADVGIAVASGSDIAIDAADLILLDQFHSIVDAMRMGRLVFQNLQKVICYLLPAGSWSEIWPVILNVFFGTPLPLGAFLMVVICVFTDLFLSLSLIMEKEEFDLLSLPPRDHRKDHLINTKIYGQAYFFTGTIETLMAHSMFFLYMWKYAKIPIRDLFFLYERYREGYYGYTEDQLDQFRATGQCVYFVTLLYMQWGNVLAVRNRRMSILQSDPIRKQRRNPWLVVSILVSLTIAIFVTEVPGIQRLFDTASVPIEFWFIPLPLGLSILFMDEIRKLIVRTYPESLLAKVAW
jgi:sodium/potassium-transporting ATPase subunit alpha